MPLLSVNIPCPVSHAQSLPVLEALSEFILKSPCMLCRMQQLTVTSESQLINHKYEVKHCYPEHCRILLQINLNPVALLFPLI